jgi:biopolymer transport protein ExbD
MKHHKGKRKHVIINLVAMIDMLTVLVFFLLVYSTEQVTVVDPKDVQLPQSLAETQIENTVVVVVGEQDIVVHGRAIARIDEILASDDPLIWPLQAELEADETNALRLAALPEEERIAARQVTIMADKELPFILLRKVMATSTAAGYGQLSLAVMQKPSDLVLATVASND